MDELVDKWIKRKGMFCIVDYESSDGLSSAMGKVTDVENRILIITNLANGEIIEVSIDAIKNSKVRELRNNKNE